MMESVPWTHAFCIIGSIICFFFVCAALAALPRLNPDIYGHFMMILRNPQTWLWFLLALMIPILLELAIQYYFTMSGSGNLLQVLKERMRVRAGTYTSPRDRLITFLKSLTTSRNISGSSYTLSGALASTGGAGGVSSSQASGVPTLRSPLARSASTTHYGRFDDLNNNNKNAVSSSDRAHTGNANAFAGDNDTAMTALPRDDSAVGARVMTAVNLPAGFYPDDSEHLVLTPTLVDPYISSSAAAVLRAGAGSAAVSAAAADGAAAPLSAAAVATAGTGHGVLQNTLTDVGRARPLSEAVTAVPSATPAVAASMRLLGYPLAPATAPAAAAAAAAAVAAASAAGSDSLLPALPLSAFALTSDNNNLNSGHGSGSAGLGVSERNLVTVVPPALANAVYGHAGGYGVCAKPWEAQYIAGGAYTMPKSAAAMLRGTHGLPASKGKGKGKGKGRGMSKYFSVDDDTYNNSTYHNNSNSNLDQQRQQQLDGEHTSEYDDDNDDEDDEDDDDDGVVVSGVSAGIARERRFRNIAESSLCKYDRELPNKHLLSMINNSNSSNNGGGAGALHASDSGISRQYAQFLVTPTPGSFSAAHGHSAAAHGHFVGADGHSPESELYGVTVTTYRNYSSTAAAATATPVPSAYGYSLFSAKGSSFGLFDRALITGLVPVAPSSDVSAGSGIASIGSHSSRMNMGGYQHATAANGDGGSDNVMQVTVGRREAFLAARALMLVLEAKTQAAYHSAADQKYQKQDKFAYVSSNNNSNHVNAHNSHTSTNTANATASSGAAVAAAAGAGAGTGAGASAGAGKSKGKGNNNGNNKSRR